MATGLWNRLLDKFPLFNVAEFNSKYWTALIRYGLNRKRTQTAKASSWKKQSWTPFADKLLPQDTESITFGVKIFSTTLKEWHAAGSCRKLIWTKLKLVNVWLLCWTLEEGASFSDAKNSLETLSPTAKRIFPVKDRCSFSLPNA